LKEKYGDKMIDLVPDEYGACLYGDSYRAFGLIENFRMGIQNEKNTK
jgi:hypothetical protein